MVPIAPPAGFIAPTFDAPLDVDALKKVVPEKATFKGTVVHAALDAVREAGLAPPTTKNYVAFKDYPIGELLDIFEASARLLYPDVPLREGLRRLGRAGYSAFSQTVVGKLVYGVFGGNLTSLFRMANKGYEMTQNTGKVRTTVVDDNAVRLSFTSCFTFLNTYHYGIIESTLAAGKVSGGGIWLHETSLSDGDYYVAWQPRTATEQNASSAT